VHRQQGERGETESEAAKSRERTVQRVDCSFAAGRIDVSRSRDRIESDRDGRVFGSRDYVSES